MDPARILVIDDFYPDPDAVRGRALAGAYQRHAWRPKFCEWFEFFPEQEVEDAVMLRLGEALGTSISYDPHLQGFFRVLSEAQYQELLKKPVLIHIDNYDWSGLLCLNPDAQLAATGKRIALPFMRHKATGLANLAGNHEWTAQMRAESSDFSRWDLVTEVELKYNRMILFNPRAFHLLAPGFGNDLDDSKLVQQFQFNEDRAR